MPSCCCVVKCVLVKNESSVFGLKCYVLSRTSVVWGYEVLGCCGSYIGHMECEVLGYRGSCISRVGYEVLGCCDSYIGCVR